MTEPTNEAVKVKPLSKFLRYLPRDGCTGLIDAIAHAIDDHGRKCHTEGFKSALKVNAEDQRCVDLICNAAEIGGIVDCRDVAVVRPMRDCYSTPDAARRAGDAQPPPLGKTPTCSLRCACEGSFRGMMIGEAYGGAHRASVNP